MTTVKPTEPLDPIATSDRILTDYLSYLRTSFALANDDLQRDLDRRLQEEGRFQKGPLLQASPPYMAGRSLTDLVESGVMHPAIAREAGSALPAHRPLYVHQELGITQLQQGRNAVVATGTGSGKTEVYLLSILDHLLRERDAGTLSDPGVRALLLYPMNALANDQLKRIRDLFSGFHGLTFGRYVGDTDPELREAVATYRAQVGGDPKPGELIDRASMQARPPHVLVTNYAMLEYLLLRPADSSFFDGPTGKHWKFIVLDEVHVYDGAKGAEIAMLLRRVRDRVNGSQRGVLQCVATSATLGRGATDSPLVADFASKLFDETFDPEDVVLPIREKLDRKAPSWSLDEEHLNRLHATWAASGDAAALNAAVGRDHAVPGSASATLFSILQDEEHVVALQISLSETALPMDELLPYFTGFADPLAATVKLVELCVAARPDEQSASLLPARYHLFLRASEGAFVCWHPEHPEVAPRIFLERQVHCPECAAYGRQSRAFELSICRLCGIDYAYGRLDQGRLTHAGPFDDTGIHLLRAFEFQSSTASVDEDVEAVEGVASVSTDHGSLCVVCGMLDNVCDCGDRRTVDVIRVTSRDSRLRRCGSCGRHSTTAVTNRLLTGSEAPVSVVATSLYQSLPPSPNPGRRASAEGRKLLVFSDSRQDAAFFAPYLRRTYSRAVERRLIWTVLAEQDEPVTMDDIELTIVKRAEKYGVLDEALRRSNRNEVRSWLFAEIIATDRRQSLDGVGLSEILPALPRGVETPTSLSGLGLTPGESLDVLRVLLDTLRHSAAVTEPEGVSVRDDVRFAPRNITTTIRGDVSEYGVLAWAPARGSNRRLSYLERLSRAAGWTAALPELLRALWFELIDLDGQFVDLLKIGSSKSRGDVHALDPARIEFRTGLSGAIAYRCDRCKQIAWRSVLDVCPTFRCSGTLKRITASRPNHYRSLYEGLSPIGMRIAEHTAQLRAREAGRLQELFIRGEMNVLSSSTTFELGVDVGDVQSVLMRNVPPSPANYVQRAGRAGRRLNSPALIVTFAQRRSHDLHFFASPGAMVNGHVAPPIISVENEPIIRRHVHAVAFSAFERWRVERGLHPARSVADYLDASNGLSPRTEFLDWLRAHPEEVGVALKRITPSSAHDSLGIDSWQWVERLEGPDPDGVGGWLTAAFDDIERDIDELGSLSDRAFADKKGWLGDRYKKSARTLRDRRLLDFLAQRGVLPKYGFPVDVVDLDISRSKDADPQVELDRDLRLALLEFAPGATVVANGKLWKSVGLRQQPGRELPEWRWAQCDQCGLLRTAITEERIDEGCLGCGSAVVKNGRRGKFVIPIFGFIGEHAGEPGESRPPREGTLETFFSSFDGAAPHEELRHFGGTTVIVRQSRRGWITVFNRGRSKVGFWVCDRCGFASDTPPAKAKTPGPSVHKRPNTEADCQGSMAKIDLGHRFLTDVVELTADFSGSSYSTEQYQLSFNAALISALPFIGIASNDVNGSPASGPGGSPSVVLYDDVPGGAGHTRFVAEHLHDLLRGALERVDRCECGEDTSCYGCLRSYRNQRDHDALIRGAALDMLRRILGAPDEQVSNSSRTT